MPAQELPKVLRNLMDTLMDGNQLHSWNIFEERNGQIVVKIKFSGGHIDQPQQASYKRKPPNQVRRDETRLAKHRDRVTTAAPKPVCLSTPLQQDENKQRTCDTPRPLSPVLRRSQRHKPVEDLSIEQTRGAEIDDEYTNQINVSTLSLNTSSSRNSLLALESISLNPQASLFTPADRNPHYSAPFMEHSSLQRSVESSEDNEIDTKYMDNSEDICSSDLTAGVSDTLTELSTSGTEKKMEEPPPLRQPS